MKSIWLVLVLGFLTNACYAVESAQKNNVVLILADDLGWSDLACYGSDLHETPHLDRLAGEHIRFNQAYAASPVCTPTRASILTGRHPARLNMTIWRENALNRGNRALLEPVTLDALPLEETTLAELLKQAGYYTAHVGKWHLGSAEAYPQPHGFDVNIGGTLWGAPQSFFYPFSGDHYFSDWRYVPDLEPGEEGDYLTDRLTDKAIEIMERHAGKRPFFLNICYHSVHTPIEGKPHLVRKYKDKIGKEQPTHHLNPDYAAMVESLDENVGRVLSRLDTLGIRDQTLVLFLSDNGGFTNGSRLQNGMPVTSNAPLRSGKGSCYEGGVRVPMIIDLPGNNDVSRVIETPVTTCDLFPTLLSALGVAWPKELVLDGVDISSLWKSDEADLGRDALYFHYPHYYPTTTPVSAIRQGPWKLLQYFENQSVELYHLGDDPGEKENLAGSRRTELQRLLAQLENWRQSVLASMPESNPRKR